VRAGRALIRRFEEAFPEPPRGAPPRVDLLYNPRDLFSYRSVGGAPLEPQLHRLDELDRLASRLVYYQYFEPDLSGADLRRFDSEDSGLLVEAVADPLASLQVGDYILEVDGLRVAGRHTFERAFLRRLPGQEVPLVVERDGARLSLRLPVRRAAD
jgi:hypothetical protein